MSDNDPNPPNPPVADDDFPEFAEPPRHRPAHAAEPERDQPSGGVQEGVDEVLERLRRRRKQGEG